MENSRAAAQRIALTQAARLVPLLTHTLLSRKLDKGAPFRFHASSKDKAPESNFRFICAPAKAEPKLPFGQQVARHLVFKLIGRAPRPPQRNRWDRLARSKIRVTVNIGSVQFALSTELKEVLMAKQNPARLGRRVLVRPRLLPSTFIALSLALGSAACSQAPQKPAASPLKQAKKDDRPPSQDELELERRNVAPPPAYGNKVVMAKSESDVSRQF
jgi:hypothetical protein